VTLLAWFAIAAGVRCGDNGERPGGVAATPVASITPTPRADAALQSFDRGHSFAYTNNAGALWYVDAATGEQRQLAARVDLGHQSEVWSPDGERIAYRDAEGRLIVHEWTSDEPARVIDSDVTDIAWSTDSRLLSYGKGAHFDDNWIADVDGPHKISLVERRIAEFSPDGRHALVYRPVAPSETAPRGGAYEILDLDNWEFEPIDAPIDGYVPPVWSPSGRYLAYWKQNVGGSAIIGPMAIYDTTTDVAQDIGEFTDDETPQWAPSKERDVFHNLEIDRDTGTVTELFPRPGAWDFSQAAFPQPGAVVGWSPDMRSVVSVEGRGFGAGPRRLVALEPETGKRVVLNENDETLSHPSAPGYFGSWSPNSRYFAFGVMHEEDGSGGMEWAVYDRESATTEPIDVPLVTFASFSPDGRYLLLTTVSDSPAPPPVYSLVVANADGSNAHNLADGVAISTGPNGHWRGWRPAGE
jgi:Tol biopolymer transport system component